MDNCFKMIGKHNNFYKNGIVKCEKRCDNGIRAKKTAHTRAVKQNSFVDLYLSAFVPIIMSEVFFCMLRVFVYEAKEKTQPN